MLQTSLSDFPLNMTFSEKPAGITTCMDEVIFLGHYDHGVVLFAYSPSTPSCSATPGDGALFETDTSSNWSYCFLAIITCF